ncbi:hypothetical protein H2203_007935 [Taxawa tesnikishii (nom. ined.)]|nr:hypothetical protein H2203_007935 [Dothideales sp. JES 119]
MASTTIPTDGASTPATRTVPLQVLSLGMGRTGTSSMSKALLKLGYDHTYHGLDMMDRHGDAFKWDRAVDAKFYRKSHDKLEQEQEQWTREDWRRFFDEVLGHCAAVTDLPCNFFWRELVDAYPEAKVVLVERDIDKWYPSFADTVVGQSFMFSSDIIIYVVEPLLGMRLGHMVRRLLLGYFNASTEKEILANMKTVYRRHYDEIRATMPKDRLLEMDLKDGWGPLCAFLGKEVPNESFPHVNEVQELKNKVWEKQKELFWQTGNFLATWILPVAVAGTAGHWYTRR